MAVFRQLAWVLLLHRVVINAGLGLLCRINNLLIAIVINWVFEGLIDVLPAAVVLIHTELGLLWRVNVAHWCCLITAQNLKVKASWPQFLGKWSFYFQILSTVCPFLAWNLTKNKEILKLCWKESMAKWCLNVEFLGMNFMDSVGFLSVLINMDQCQWCGLISSQGKCHIHACSSSASFHFDGKNPKTCIVPRETSGFLELHFSWKTSDIFRGALSTDIGSNTVHWSHAAQIHHSLTAGY